MNDERFGRTVTSWLRDEDPTPPDSLQSARQVAARLPLVRQQSRWWPLPLLRRTPAPTRAADTIEYQPSPVPASNGHTPTVIGRTTSMLSPVKAITAGALVFAIGGAFLIAQPFQQQGSVPGAEAEAVAPTWVTGTIASAPSCSSGDLELDGDVRRYTDVECSPQTWTSTDPRLSGEVVRRWSEDNYPTDEGTISVSVGAAHLRNDGGEWACFDTSLLRGSGMSSEAVTDTTFACTGDGGYAGLSAILVSSSTTGFNEEFVGLVFSGDFPPVPEPPAAE
jgi:hypothetical protein